MLLCIISAKKREAKQSSSADSESDSYADKTKKKKKSKKRYINKRGNVHFEYQKLF